MPSAKSAGTDASTKMGKGLKVYKQALKEKSRAKRTAIVARSKAHNIAPATFIKLQVELILQELTRSPARFANEYKYIVSNDPKLNDTRDHTVVTTSNDAVKTSGNNDGKTMLVDHTLQSALDPTIAHVARVDPAQNLANDCFEKISISAPFDIHAHRKAVEAALYDSMETPKEMLARLKKSRSADAEYHHDIVDDEPKGTLKLNDIAKHARVIECVDDNGFRIHSSLYDQVPALKLPTIIVNQKVSTVNAAMNRLTDINTKHQTVCCTTSMFPSPVNAPSSYSGSIERRFSATSDGSIRAGKPSKMAIERSTAPVETGIVSITGKNVSDVPALIDPAIISYRIKKPDGVINGRSFDQTFDSTIPMPDCASAAASEKLKALLGITTPEITSTIGSKNSQASTPSAECFATPPTPHSVSPPAVQNGFSGKIRQALSDSMGSTQAPHYSYYDGFCYQS